MNSNSQQPLIIHPQIFLKDIELSQYIIYNEQFGVLLFDISYSDSLGLVDTKSKYQTQNAIAPSQHTQIDNSVQIYQSSKLENLIVAYSDGIKFFKIENNPEINEKELICLDIFDDPSFYESYDLHLDQTKGYLIVLADNLQSNKYRKLGIFKREKNQKFKLAKTLIVNILDIEIIQGIFSHYLEEEDQLKITIVCMYGDSLNFICIVVDNSDFKEIKRIEKMI